MIELEIWKSIEETNGKYQVSSWGRIRNAETGKILKPYENKKGYLKVGLSTGRRSEKKRVNRLVAAALKPKVIDRDRRKDGDIYRKPTQYWFVGFDPKCNLLADGFAYVDTVKALQKVTGKNGKKREVLRSEIHPQYANRFIRRYILDGKPEDNRDDEITIFDFLKEGDPK